MSEEESSAENEPKSARVWALALILGFSGLLAATCSALWTVRQKTDCGKCKGTLKQIGLCIQSYYSDGTTPLMPIFSSPKVDALSGGLGFDPNMLNCYANRDENINHYVWNPKVSGGRWSHWNNPNSALIWDASPHRVNGKINAVFGDGHVEEISVEKMQEMMR